jgi:hypothetical protein
MNDFSDFTWTIRRGTHEYRDFTVKTDALPTDLSSYTLWFTVKRRLADADAAAVFQLTLGSGITLTNAAQGEGYLEVIESETSDLPNYRQKFYADFFGRSSTGQVFPLESGMVIVLPSVKDPI